MSSKISQSWRRNLFSRRSPLLAGTVERGKALRADIRGGKMVIVNS